MSPSWCCHNVFSDPTSSSCSGEQVEDIYLIISSICVAVKVDVLYRTIYCVVPRTYDARVQMSASFNAYECHMSV